MCSFTNFVMYNQIYFLKMHSLNEVFIVFNIKYTYNHLGFSLQNSEIVSVKETKNLKILT